MNIEELFSVGLTIKDFLNRDYCAEVIKNETDFGNDRISAVFATENLGNSAVLNVSAGFTTPIEYDRRLTFSSFESVSILLKPKFEPEAIMCNYYYLEEKNDCWTTPFWCSKFEELPERIASLIFKYKDKYYHIFPLCCGDFKAELSGSGNGLRIDISANMGGYTQIACKAAVVTADVNPYKAIKQNAAAGFNALGKRPLLREDKKLPELFDYLGWCSWETFRKNVTSAGVYKKLEEFADKKLPIKWALIDDGWYQTKDKKLWSMKADAENFPEGLKAFIEKSKSQYDIKWIGMWQCFGGYWEGIHPDSPVAREEKDITYRTNGGFVLPNPEEGKNFEFWNKWNIYLKNEGVDFVKVDVENSLAAYIYNNMSVCKAARGSHRGMEGSVSMLFGGACINCTGMGTESLWNRENGIVNRNSLDFDPRKKETMRLFITQNVYNSFFNSVFYHADWDMMWSDSPTTKLNVVLHAISGGIVYISDLPGETNADTIIPFADHNGRLLKCSGALMPVRECLFADPENTVLKAFNYTPLGGVIGVFNLTENKDKTAYKISPMNIEGFSQGEYAVYDWFEKKVTFAETNDELSFESEQFDAKIFNVFPRKKITVIGLTDKYIPDAAVSVTYEEENRFMGDICTGGEFAFICDGEPNVKINGKNVPVCGKDGFYTVDTSKYNCEYRIEISIQVARI